MAAVLLTLPGGKLMTCNNKLVTSPTVTIGAHQYPYAKFGSMYWITDSFREEIPKTYKVGTTGGNAYYKDEASIPTNGIYYDKDAVQNYITPMLPAGWRVASWTDWRDILTVTGSTAAMFDGPFNLHQSGFVYTSQDRVDGEGDAYVRSSSNDSTYAWLYRNNGYIRTDSYWGDIYCSIRICKDA